MKYKFKWEKWIDPLAQKNFKQPEPEPENDDDENPQFGSFKAFPTPFGMLTITDHILASSRFDFWLLHTNFPITNEIAHIMKQVPGVETMNILTRYRVRFGFPKSGLFNSTGVKQQVQCAVLSVVRQHQDELLSNFDPVTFRKAQEVRDNLDQNNEHWALYVLPNGNMEVLKQKVMRDSRFDKQLEEFRRLQQLIGGTLLTSDEA
jgi:hypothetical protein